MQEWLGALLIWILSVTAYDHPEQLPEITAISQQQLIETLCGGQLCPALAYYDTDLKTIFYDQRLDIEGDLNARSFIVHEIVHYLQDMGGAIDIMTMSCEQRMVMEREAYTVQGLFLQENGLPSRQIALAMSLLAHVCQQD